MTLLAQYSPSGSVIGMGHQSPRFMPGPSASVLTHVIIRLMIQEIGDTPPMTTVVLLPNLSPEKLTLNLLVSPSCHGDESDSDCQIQEGSEPDSSTALASDGLGQPRGTRPARREEVETLKPSSIRLWRDWEWQRTLQVGKGLNNLNFCNAVLQCLTQTSPLANFCLDHGHSRRLDNAATTVAYEALQDVERRVIEAFGSSQSSIAPTAIVKSNQDGPTLCCRHSTRCARVSTIFNSQHAPRRPEGGWESSSSPSAAHQHAPWHFWWTPTQPGALRIVPHQQCRVRHFSGLVT